MPVGCRTAAKRVPNPRTENGAEERRGGHAAAEHLHFLMTRRLTVTWVGGEVHVGDSP